MTGIQKHFKNEIRKDKRCKGVKPVLFIRCPLIDKLESYYNNVQAPNRRDADARRRVWYEYGSLPIGCRRAPNEYDRTSAARIKSQQHSKRVPRCVWSTTEVLLGFWFIETRFSHPFLVIDLIGYERIFFLSLVVVLVIYYNTLFISFSCTFLMLTIVIYIYVSLVRFILAFFPVYYSKS